MQHANTFQMPQTPTGLQQDLTCLPTYLFDADCCVIFYGYQSALVKKTRADNKDVPCTTAGVALAF